jgi:hypothetical protein
MHRYVFFITTELVINYLYIFIIRLIGVLRYDFNFLLFIPPALINQTETQFQLSEMVSNQNFYTPISF